MDASAFVTKDEWEDILTKNGCDEVTVLFTVNIIVLILYGISQVGEHVRSDLWY